MLTTFTFGQETKSKNKQVQEIYALIDTYSQARTAKDSVLLRSILTVEIDQLVSSGVWRRGRDEAFKGMMQSSESNPGSRKISVERVRFLNSECAIADARYEIQNTDGSVRKMWSTFMVVHTENRWKITAIRNMLPTRQQ